MRTASKNFLLLAAVLACLVSMSACTSAAQRSRKLLASGDYAGALEQLAPALTRKPDDKASVELFVQLYPAIMETLKADAARFMPMAAGDTLVTARLVETLEQLLRIQRAVLPMPVMIGNKRQGFVRVEKYPDNFAEQLSDARLAAAAAWYDQADRSFPGQNRIEKEALIRQYERVFGYVADYRDTRERIARLAYQIAEDYEIRASIPDLRKAVEWLGVVEHWATNYLDSAGRRQMLAHRLGQLLKAEGTRAAYDEAYQFFRLAGNYDNAAAEVQLYEFNRKVLQLSNEATGRNAVVLGSSADQGGPKLSHGPKRASADNPFMAVSALNVQSSRFTLFSPDNHGIYPGAVFDGTALPEAVFRPLAADRLPLSIRLNREGYQDMAELVLSDPGQGTRVQASINQALQQQATDLRPRLDWRLEPCTTPEQVQMALGFGFGKERIALGRNLPVNTTTSYALLELRLVSHVVMVEEPRMPADFFASLGAAIVSPGQLGAHAPYYVSRMEYGHQTWLLLAADDGQDNLREQVVALLQGGYSGTVIKNSSLRIIDHVSGDGRHGSIRDTGSLAAWLQSRLEPGKTPFAPLPLSFQLRSLKDNSVAHLQQSIETSTATQLRLVVVPLALQMDKGSVNQLALNAYASGGLNQPQNPAQDPDRARPGTSAWQAALNTGEVFVTLDAKGDTVRWAIDNGRPYTSIASSPETPIFVGLKAGYRQASGDVRWLDFQFMQLKAADILRDNANWRSLRDEGLYFSSPDFAGRLYFDIRLEQLN